jgi:hypothetical protein
MRPGLLERRNHMAVMWIFGSGWNPCRRRASGHSVRRYISESTLITPLKQCVKSLSSMRFRPPDGDRSREHPSIASFRQRVDGGSNPPSRSLPVQPNLPAIRPHRSSCPPTPAPRALPPVPLTNRVYRTGDIFLHVSTDTLVQIITKIDSQTVLVLDEASEMLICAQTRFLRGPVGTNSDYSTHVPSIHFFTTHYNRFNQKAIIVGFFIA